MIQVLSDTWQQAARTIGYAAALWRQRELRYHTRSAVENLGLAAYEDRCGDLQLREQVADLDSRIKKATDEKKSLYRLRRARSALLQSLGQSLLVDPTEQLKESDELRNARATDATLKEHAILLSERRDKFLPAGLNEAGNVLLGCCLVALSASSLGYFLTQRSSHVVPLASNKAHRSPKTTNAASSFERESTENRQVLERDSNSWQGTAAPSAVAESNALPVAVPEAQTSESQSVSNKKLVAVAKTAGRTGTETPPSSSTPDMSDPPEAPGNFQNSKQSLLELSQLADEILMKNGEFSQEGSVLLIEIAEVAAAICDYKTLFKIESAIEQLPKSLSERTRPLLCDLAAKHSVISGLHKDLDGALNYLQNARPQTRAIGAGFSGTAIAFGQSTRPSDADKVFAEFEKVVEAIRAPDAKIHLLTELGGAQAHLGLLERLSRTNEQLDKLWLGSQEQNMRRIADANIAIAIALAESGNFEAAEEKQELLKSLLPNSEHQDLALRGIAAAYARSLNFRDALLAASKINDDITRCQCLLTIHSRVVALHPLFDDLARRLGDEMLREVPKLRGKLGFAEIECQAMVNSVLWERTDVTERYVGTSAAPYYKSRAILALAVHAAQKDEETRAENYLEQALNEILEVQDAERRRPLLVELGRVAFVCQAQDFLNEKVADRDVIVRASILLGAAKGVIAQDEIESAFNNRLVYAGTTEQPELFFLESKKNQTWTGFREKAQETFSFDSFGEYLYEKRPKFEVLAVPGTNGLDIAYPPSLAGFVAATKLFTLGYFGKSEIDSIGRVCDGPTNQPINIGRFTAEKRFLDRPTGWLVIKIREANNSK